MISTLNEYIKKNNLLFLVLLIIFAYAIPYYSPVDYTDTDSWGTFLTSQAILEHGTIKLDAYSEVFPAYGGRIRQANNNHSYHYYSIGPALLTTPFVWLANLRGENMAGLTSPYRNENQSKLQNLLSAITIAISALLIYTICRCYLNYVYSYLFTISFVFGSSIASTMGTALWNINSAMVFVLSAILILVYEDQNKTQSFKPIILGGLLFLAYLCRPTASLFILTTFAYILLKNRRDFIKLFVTCSILFSLFILFSILEFNRLLPPYYNLGGFLFSPFIKSGIYGSLFSPSRGLFIFSPIFLIPIILLVIFGRKIYKEGLIWFGAVWLTLYLLMIWRWEYWMGGYCFGPRMLTDIIPALLLLTVITWGKAVTTASKWLRGTLLISFIVLAFASIFINTHQGLFNPSTADWNWAAKMMYNPQYLFDWKYPQFLANPKMIKALEAERKYIALNPYKPGQEILPNSKRAIYLGWHLPEANFTIIWSDEKSAKILLKIRPKDYEGISTLNLVINAATYQPQKINVLINGSEVGVIDSQEHLTPLTYTLPIDMSILGLDDKSSLKSKRVEIEFFSPQASIPAAVDPNLNPDPRSLGMSLHWLKIVADE